MFNLIKNPNIDLDNINISDIRNICLEMAYHDPKANKNGKINPKYTKKLDKLTKQISDARYSGKDVNLDKVFKKMDKLIGNYTRLNPNMDIKIVASQGKRIAEISETEGKGKISSLKQLYSSAKNNEIKHEQERKESRKREEARKRAEKEQEESEKDPDKIAAREETLENKRKANDFINSLKVQNYRNTIDARQSEIMEQYQNAQGGVAWREMQNDPEIKAAKKALEESEGR